MVHTFVYYIKKNREITNNTKSTTTQVKTAGGSPLEFRYKRLGQLPVKQYLNFSKPKLTVKQL